MISLSRLIKSAWTSPGEQQNKVISIKSFKSVEPEVVAPSIQADFQEDKEKILQEARLEAEQLISETEANIQFMYQQIEQEKIAWEEEKLRMAEEARQSGYKHGFSEGQQRGYEEYKVNISEAKQVVEDSKQDYFNKIESSESTILDIGLRVAERILGEKIDGNTEQFLTIVKRALKEARDYKEVQLHIHPIHYGYLLSQKEDLVRIFPKETELYIYPDEELSQQSCIIESANGRIDASVDQQLEEIKRKLFELLESE
ncbi:flagellar assembly protein FliH [Cytobacillus sp. FJAT-54145]|uniref:Flagellar assembly protein FliH n=1 Tax=Cytobacillus spartinae TaxID=3299023 RepID=A0ABW6K4H5_9BACI